VSGRGPKASLGALRFNCFGVSRDVYYDRLESAERVDGTNPQSEERHDMPGTFPGPLTCTRVTALWHSTGVLAMPSRIFRDEMSNRLFMSNNTLHSGR
jgi:hypothetical protein